MLKKLMPVLGVFITTLIFFQPAFAEINSVEMQVDGMTCPFCVYGIEKKLEALGEVQSVSSNLKRGNVSIQLKKNGSVNIGRLNEAINESGFTPGKIKINATGRLTTYKLEGKENPALKVTGSGQVFLLTGAPGHETEESLEPKELEELENASGNTSEEITITGYIHSHPSGVPPALSIEGFEVK
jgi:copper chaperone CopZ